MAAGRRRPSLRAECEVVLPPCDTCGQLMVRQRTRNFDRWRTHGFVKHGAHDSCRSCYGRSLRGLTGPARTQITTQEPDSTALCLDCGDLIGEHKTRTLSDGELARLRRMVGAA